MQICHQFVLEKLLHSGRTSLAQGEGPPWRWWPQRAEVTNNTTTTHQSGALSLVGIVEIVLSLVESFIELKYFHDVATPALLCHKEPARRIQSLLLTPRWFFMDDLGPDLGSRVLHSGELWAIYLIITETTRVNLVNRRRSPCSPPCNM